VGKEDKKVIDLYTVFKLSEQQIAERLNINPSRVRWVLKKHGIQKRTISEAVRQLYITKFGKKEFVLNKKLTSEQERLKLAGVMLYWGEGDKKVENSQVRLSNSEPGMVKVFYLFLIGVMKIPSEKI